MEISKVIGSAESGRSSVVIDHRRPLLPRRFGSRLGPLVAVVRKEVLHHLVNYRYLTGSVLTLLLSALAALAGAIDLEQRTLAYQAQVEQAEAELREVQVYSFLQPVAVRPPELLSVFAHGFEGRLENEVTIHVFEVPIHTSAEIRRNPFMTLLQGLDLTTIVRDVLGLLALLLTFDALAGERDRGNLALALAQGVDRGVLLAGKFLGAFLVLGVPMALSVLTTLGILVSREGLHFQPRHGWRMAFLLAAYAGYIAVMLLVGLTLSLRAANASRALAYSLIGWAVLVYLYPQTAVAGLGELAARRGDPHGVARAVHLLEVELDARLRERWNEDPLLSRNTGHRSISSLYGVNRGIRRRLGSARYYDALARYYDDEVTLGREYAERIFELRREDTAVRRRVERQAELWASLSPAYLLDQWAASLAGTAFEDHEAFFSAGRAYREKLMAHFGREGAFGSRRWFTDDLSGTRSWVSFLGAAPEDVDESNFGEFLKRALDPELRERRLEVEQDLDVTSDPAWLQKLADVPRFHFTALQLPGALRRKAPEIGLLLAIGVLTAWYLRRGFKAWGIR